MVFSAVSEFTPLSEIWVKGKIIVAMDETGAAPYCFFAPGGTYTVLAGAVGCQSEFVEIANLQADQNIPEIYLQPKLKPSFSIISKQVGSKQMRLCFRHNNANGATEDWNEENTIQISFFSPQDDPQSTGKPSDPNHPHGLTIQLIDHNHVGTEGMFPERYLTCRNRV